MNKNWSAVNATELSQIVRGYIITALWTEEERINQENDETKKSIDDLSIDDYAPNSLVKANKDIKEFIELAGDSVCQYLEDYDCEQLGHDIWLTRNRHGAGFFDRKLDDEVETALTNATHELGEVGLYLNTNMQLVFV